MSFWDAHQAGQGLGCGAGPGPSAGTRARSLEHQLTTHLLDELSARGVKIHDYGAELT